MDFDKKFVNGAVAGSLTRAFYAAIRAKAVKAATLSAWCRICATIQYSINA